MYKIKLLYSPDVESPCENDGWKVYSFSTRHKNYADPEHFRDANGKTTLGIRNKLRAGTAFFLSYYEHGNCQWSLNGEGPYCPWDSRNMAGIIVWEQDIDNLGPKTYEERESDARAFLKVYTDWVNGDIYFFSIEQDGHPIDSCRGLIGDESLADAVRELLPNDATPDNTEFDGEAAWLTNYHNFFKKESTAS